MQTDPTPELSEKKIIFTPAYIYVCLCICIPFERNGEEEVGEGNGVGKRIPSQRKWPWTSFGCFNIPWGFKQTSKGKNLGVEGTGEEDGTLLGRGKGWPNEKKSELMFQTWCWASIEQTSKNFWVGNNRNRKETTLSKKATTPLVSASNKGMMPSSWSTLMFANLSATLLTSRSMLRDASRGSHESFAFFDRDYARSVWELHFFRI